MKALHANSSTRTRAVSNKRLVSLERQGKYEAALAEISDKSLIAGFLPNTSSLDKRDASELHLRYAALLGFYGHNRQIADSQKRALDILTDTRERFIEFNDVQKVVECENHISLCYWRTGEFNEALVWIESALVKTTEIFDARLYAYVTRSLIFLSKKQYDDNIRDCTRLLPMFFGYADSFLTGSYCANIGLSLKNAGKTDEALRYLELARDQHTISKHRVYLGTAENNLAQLYKSKRQYSRAHASIDAATLAFRQAKDRTREGFSLDTKALIYYSEREFDLAARTAEVAIRILRKGENASYLVETLQTKFKAQIFLNDVSGAVETLQEAMEIANVQIGEECSAAIFEEFLAVANEFAGVTTNLSSVNVPGIDNLQLVLPGSLARFSDYQGLWINNSHLEPIGLTKGSLAVIVRDDIKRGDLVAILELETEMVSCGFYDEEFGIVCLEGIGTEPQLFDAAAVRILGKIVGVCSGHKDENGKIPVEPLKV